MASNIWSELEKLKKKVRTRKIRKYNYKLSSPDIDNYLRKLRKRYIADEDCCEKDLRG